MKKAQTIQTDLTRQPLAYQSSFRIRQLQEHYGPATVTLRLQNLITLGHVHNFDELGGHLLNLVGYFGIETIKETIKLFKKGA